MCNIRICTLPSPDRCGWTVSDNGLQMDWLAVSDIMPKQLVDALEGATEETTVECDSEETMEEDDVVDNIVDVIFDEEEDDCVDEPTSMLTTAMM